MLQLIWMLTDKEGALYSQKPPLKVPTDILSEASGINFSVSLH